MAHQTPDPRDRTSEDPPPNGADFSRRMFMQTLGISAAASAVTVPARRALANTKATAQDASTVRGPGEISVTLRINGEAMSSDIEPSTTLLDTLRMHLNLTGSKEVCDRGSCGGCSVLVDGELIASCMMLAVDAEGAEVTTVEGLARNGELTPVQRAFVKHDALQCGFCTPGLVVACTALLQKNAKPSLAEIKHGLSGNLCRCGTYSNVFNAVLDASGQPPVNDQGAVS